MAQGGKSHSLRVSDAAHFTVTLASIPSSAPRTSPPRPQASGQRLLRPPPEPGLCPLKESHSQAAQRENASPATSCFLLHRTSEAALRWVGFWFWQRQRIMVPFPALIGSVTLGKSLSPSGPQLPLLQNEGVGLGSSEPCPALTLETSVALTASLEHQGMPF